jgi:hypothetical protein
MSIYTEKRSTGNQILSSQKILSEILKYFQTSDFHSRKIINKFKYTVFDKVSEVINRICRSEIKINLVEEYYKLYSKKINFFSEKEIGDYISFNKEYIQEKFNSLYDDLFEELKNEKIFSEICELKLSYMIINYLKDSSKIPNSVVSLIEENVKIILFKI